jgi:hypothetical protein
MSFADDLAVLQRGCSDAEAQAFFDTLPPIAAERIFGRWRGSEIPTGHPLNGLLASFGWYGKEFVDLETVHPLLFEDDSGEIFTVDPRKVPMDLAPHVPKHAGVVGRRMLSLVRSVVGTSKPRARLRNLEFRGKVSAAMIYDHLPVQDMFRHVDETTLLGVMDRRDDSRFLYFVLRRVGARGT